MSSRKRQPDQPADQTETGNTIAVAEPAAAETSFAERVGPRKWIQTPDPFEIARDNLAGVRLLESKQDRQMAIKFGEGRKEDKPSQAVIDRIKDAGYRWNPADRIWAHQVSPESARATRIEAERLYQEVRQMIRQEKGIAGGQEIPF